MHLDSSRFTRWGVLPLALALAVASMGAQGRSVASQLGVVHDVRTALGRGEVSTARQVAFGEAGEAADRQLGQALIDLHEGRDAEARTRLMPLAEADPLGEAALELGLLELRTGLIEEGRRRLDRLAAVRTFGGPDDYLRLARAARGMREYLLANDAFQRVSDVPRADIHTAWGDLFLRGHQPADAMTSYREALGYDDRWLPALIGIARANATESQRVAEEALDRIEELAPDYPDLWLVRAEVALEGEDVEAAASALDRLAALKPGTVDEAALRVGLAYEASGLAGVESTIGAVDAINPRSALGYRRAGQQAAREYRFDDAAVLAARAVALDPDDAEAQFELGLYRMRTGDEGTARMALERSWALDRSSALTKNMLDLLDTIDGFETVQHGNMIFKFAPEEADVLEAYALPLADEAYAEFVERYQIEPDGPLLIEIFPRHDDFAVRTLGLPGLVGALGACFGRVVTMDSPRARPPGDFSWHATLWHELAHVFTLQLSDYRVPRWLTEGVSTYEEHRRQPAWGRELALQYARAFGANEHFGVKRLPEAFKRPESLALAYFEASLVVEHLVAENGEAGLRTLLVAYADGADDEAAFERAFGRTVDDVDASFNRFIATRYGALAKSMAEPRPAEIDPSDLPALRARAEANPDNFISQASYGRALVEAERLDEARAVLEVAAELAPQASGDNAPRAILARIAETQEDFARARREWRALLEYDHTNIAAARRLAALAADAGAEADENFALRLVADLDPFDANVHDRLGRRLLAGGDAEGAAIEFQAAVALGPTNPAETQTNLAEALLALGRRDEARDAVMSALRAAPTYARAQDLLLRTTGGGR